MLVVLAALIGCSAVGADLPAGDEQAAAGSDSVSTSQAADEDLAALPKPTAGTGIDENINQETIDDYLNREDVAYRETRMLYDPASFGEGTQSNLTQTLPGFKVTPYPYLGDIPIALDGAYSGPKLYTVVWNEDGTIASVKANYEESDRIMADLFPKDKAIFLQCGAGAYAGFAKALLIELGWDAEKIYNVGGNWSYNGTNAVDLSIPGEEGETGRTPIASWRADAACIDFSQLHTLDS
jgi:hypothetical protein